MPRCSPRIRCKASLDRVSHETGGIALRERTSLHSVYRTGASPKRSSPGHPSTATFAPDFGEVGLQLTRERRQRMKKTKPEIESSFVEFVIAANYLAATPFSWSSRFCITSA